MNIKITEIREMLSEKGGMILISSVLALVMWFFVVGSQNKEISKSFEARLEMLNSPAGLRAFSSTKTIAITLTGSRRAINALDAQSLVVDADLNRLSVGTHTVPVSFNPPARMKLSQMAPTSVDVTLTREIYKTLSVKVLEPENMPNGYIMDGATVSPAAVVAHGREDQLAGVFEVIARPTLAQLQGEQPIRVALQVPNDFDWSLSPSEVTIDAALAEMQQRSEANVVVETRGTLPSYLVLKKPITPNPSKIAYSGHSNSLRQFFTEPVDLSQIKDSTVLHSKIVNVPDGITLLAPAMVDVHIEVEALRLRTEFSGIPVNVRGSGKNETWSVDPQQISVFVMGDAQAMKNLTQQKLGLSAYVDVSGLVTTSAYLPVQFEKKNIPGVELLTEEMDMVKVTRTVR